MKGLFLNVKMGYQTCVKKQLRESIRNIRKSLTSEKVVALSTDISKKVLGLDELVKAQNVGVYIDFDNEVTTKDLVETLLMDLKLVAAPRMLGYREMGMYLIRCWDDLENGKYGIPEPKEDEPFSGSLDVCVVPGIAFSEKGDRLGFGKGCYDRFLVNKNLCKIALAYEAQIVPYIPQEPHDILMDIIVTEKRVIRP